MKILKFAPHLIPTILSGEKNSTWRILDDKDLSLGDDLEFRNSENGEIIGHAKITFLEEKEIKNMNEEDCVGNEKFKNAEEILLNLKQYYCDGIDLNTIVKIIRFSFIKV